MLNKITHTLKYVGNKVIVLLTCFCLNNINLTAQVNDKFTENTIQIMDSLLKNYHYNLVKQTREDSMAMNRYKFGPNEVPTYSDQVYADRMKEVCSILPLTYNQDVLYWIKYYTQAAKVRPISSLILGLQHTYFPIIEEVFDKEGVPSELKYLAVVESALNPTVRSWASAVGLWQFLIGTGKEFGLRCDSYVDERCDPYKSSVAAAKYLKNLHSIYNDWLLALAAYNCGPGRVNMAIKYSGGYVDYWKIKKFLPKETADYVPAFMAAVYFMNYPAEHNLYPKWTDFTFSRDTIHIQYQQISLTQIASKTGVSVQELKDLNPELKIGVIPYSSKPYVLRVPGKIVEFCMANPNTFTTPIKNTPVIASKEPEKINNPIIYQHKTSIPANSKLLYHKISNGETVGIIADKYKVSVQDLMGWNNLKSHWINTGALLKVYVADYNKPKTTTTANNTIKPKDPKDNKIEVPKYYRVQYGDTLYDIANKHEGVTIEKICAWNNINTKSMLRVGQLLVVGK